MDIQLFNSDLVSCGLFGISDDFSEPTLSLDQRFVRNKTSTFFLRATGESMMPTIFPDDVLIVDRSIESHHGRVCVLAYQGELICKRIHNSANGLVLASDHPKFKPIFVKDMEEVRVWGVVIAKAADVR